VKVVLFGAIVQFHGFPWGIAGTHVLFFLIPVILMCDWHFAK
jgi:hypothetical protein